VLSGRKNWTKILFFFCYGKNCRGGTRTRLR
jgi:hypothetical protein